MTKTREKPGVAEHADEQPATTAAATESQGASASLAQPAEPQAPPTPPAPPTVAQLRAQGLTAAGLPLDEHHNKGGTYVIRNGVRVPRPAL